MNLPAIMILSEIIFFYRAKIEYDDSTGKVSSISKRFKADKLQRTYQSFAEQFGFSKETATDACKFLKEKGLITVEQRTVVTSSGAKLGNVTFIEPVPKAIHEVTNLDTPYGGITPIGIGQIPPDPMGVFAPKLRGNLPPTFTQSTTETLTQNTTHQAGCVSDLAGEFSKLYPYTTAGKETAASREAAFIREVERMASEEHPSGVWAEYIVSRLKSYAGSIYIRTIDNRYVPLAKNWLMGKKYYETDEDWAVPARKTIAVPYGDYNAERDQLAGLIQ